MHMPPPATARLRFCRWAPRFMPALRALYADPRVMMYAPTALSRTAVAQLAARNATHFDRHGFGLWVVTSRECGALVGVAGLTVTRRLGGSEASVELSWCLACNFWSGGYATEAARAVCAWGFQALLVDEIIAVAARSNLRSQAVMRRLGMRCSAADSFTDASLAGRYRLSQQVMYRLSREGVGQADVTWQSADDHCAGHNCGIVCQAGRML